MRLNLLLLFAFCLVAVNVALPEPGARSDELQDPDEIESLEVEEFKSFDDALEDRRKKPKPGGNKGKPKPGGNKGKNKPGGNKGKGKPGGKKPKPKPGPVGPPIIPEQFFLVNATTCCSTCCIIAFLGDNVGDPNVTCIDCCSKCRMENGWPPQFDKVFPMERFLPVLDQDEDAESNFEDDVESEAEEEFESLDDDLEDRRRGPGGNKPKKCKKGVPKSKCKKQKPNKNKTTPKPGGPDMTPPPGGMTPPPGQTPPPGMTHPPGMTTPNPSVTRPQTGVPRPVAEYLSMTCCSSCCLYNCVTYPEKCDNDHCMKCCSKCRETMQVDKPDEPGMGMMTPDPNMMTPDPNMVTPSPRKLHVESAIDENEEYEEQNVIEMQE